MFPASIKTGFSTVSSSDIGLSEETNRRIQAILIMFMGKSVELASSYAVAAGRNTVTAMDVLYALQYFAHELEHLPDIEEECEKYYNDYAEIEDEDIDDEDIEDEDIEDEDIDDEDIEDRVVDLEDALDDLKSEFEKMMGDKDEEGDEEDSEAPMDDMGDEEKEDEAVMPTSELGVEEMPVESKDETAKSNTEQMREYVEKVAEPKGEDNKAKSPVAGKNDMGGTASNIAKGSAEEKGGSAMAPKEDNMGNVNVPGGKASKSMKADSKGHGAEKKGSGETGTDSKSIIGS